MYNSQKKFPVFQLHFKFSTLTVKTHPRVEAKKLLPSERIARAKSPTRAISYRPREERQHRLAGSGSFAEADNSRSRLLLARFSATARPVVITPTLAQIARDALRACTLVLIDVRPAILQSRFYWGIPYLAHIQTAAYISRSVFVFACARPAQNQIAPTFFFRRRRGGRQFSFYGRRKPAISRAYITISAGESRDRTFLGGCATSAHKSCKDFFPVLDSRWNNVWDFAGF